MTHKEIKSKIDKIVESLDEAYRFYHKAEIMYYDRLTNGDFMIKGCYEKALNRQEQIRNKRNSALPLNELGR